MPAAIPRHFPAIQRTCASQAPRACNETIIYDAAGNVAVHIAEIVAAL